MYESFLRKIGLNEGQAQVYEYLLKNGNLAARDLVRSLRIKRGMIYKHLEDLGKQGLIHKLESPQSITRFSALPPSELREIINKKEESIRDAKLTMDALFPKLLADYKLGSGKPGVQFFEGKQALREVAFNSLSATTPIYSMLDAEYIAKTQQDLNDEYNKLLSKKKSPKKIITPDTQGNHDFYKSRNNPLVEVRFTDIKKSELTLLLETYDDKTAFITEQGKSYMGMILEDRAITLLLRSMFEQIWKHSRPL